LKIKPNLESKVYLKTYYHHERKYVLEIMIQKGENTIRGAKVKVLFQGLHMTCVATPLWAKCEDETHTSKSGNLKSSRTPATLELDNREKKTSS